MLSKVLSKRWISKHNTKGKNDRRRLPLPLPLVRVIANFIILRLNNTADLAGTFALIPAQNTNVIVASVS